MALVATFVRCGSFTSVKTLCSLVPEFPKPQFCSGGQWIGFWLIRNVFQKYLFFSLNIISKINIYISPDSMNHPVDPLLLRVRAETSLPCRKCSLNACWGWAHLNLPRAFYSNNNMFISTLTSSLLRQVAFASIAGCQGLTLSEILSDGSSCWNLVFFKITYLISRSCCSRTVEVLSTVLQGCPSSGLLQSFRVTETTLHAAWLPYNLKKISLIFEITFLPYLFSTQSLLSLAFSPIYDLFFCSFL